MNTKIGNQEAMQKKLSDLFVQYQDGIYVNSVKLADFTGQRPADCMRSLNRLVEKQSGVSAVGDAKSTEISTDKPVLIPHSYKDDRGKYYPCYLVPYDLTIKYIARQYPDYLDVIVDEHTRMTGGREAVKDVHGNVTAGALLNPDHITQFIKTGFAEMMKEEMKPMLTQFQAIAELAQLQHKELVQGKEKIKVWIANQLGISPRAVPPDVQGAVTYTIKHKLKMKEGVDYCKDPTHQFSIQLLNDNRDMILELTRGIWLTSIEESVPEEYYNEKKAVVNNYFEKED